jgi:hypothetical protein
MNKLIFFLILFLKLSVSFAQDIITLRNGSKIEAKVNEVRKGEILYLMFSNLNGPIYTISIEDAAQIDYESGATDKFKLLFDKTSAQANNYLKINPSDFKSDIVYMNVGDLLFQNITLAFERLTGKNRKLGLRIPLSINLNGTSKISSGNIDRVRNIFYSGIDVLYYPMGQGKASLVLGPSIRAGMLQYRPNQGYNLFDPNINPTYIIENTSFFSFLVQGGFILNPTNELAISTTFGVGTRRIFTSVPGTRSSGGIANFNFSVGYRF